MTFLELCKAVRQRSGISGDGPSAVTGQSGILKKVVDWVLDAERDILTNKDDWLFLRHRVHSVMQIGMYRYAVADFSMQPTRKIKSIYVDNQPIAVIEWDQYQDRFQEFGDHTKTGDPQMASLGPDGYMEVWPTPTKANVVVIDYYRTPTAMTANDSVSVLPTLYHDAIKQKALMYYADYEEDMYLYQRSQLEYDRWMSQLVADQLPVSDFNRNILFG